MPLQFDIHGTHLEVRTEHEQFKDFLEKRLRRFKANINTTDIAISVFFNEPELSEEHFSQLGPCTKINEDKMIYADGPLKCKINAAEDKLNIRAHLNPDKWKHYGRIAKKGKKRTWNEYYEYYIIRKAIQLPLMWQMQKKGFYPVHASAVEKNNKSYVFAGFGGVGKTTLGLYLAENGYKLMGDNFVFLKEGKVYPYPEMLRVTDFTLERISILERTGEKVFGQSIAKIDDQKISLEPAKLEKLFLINRGSFDTTEAENGVSRLLGMADNLQEFHSHSYASLISFITKDETNSREKIYRESLKEAKVVNLSYSDFKDVKKAIEGEQ